MSLIKFVPTYASLSTASFVDHEKDGHKAKLLTLSSMHSVHSKFGSDAVSGRAETFYKVETVRELIGRPHPNLTVAADEPSIGFQSSEELRGLLEKLRSRQSFSLAAIGDGAFDMRALAYVCGNALATVTSGLEFTYSAPCTVGLLSPTWNVPNVTNLTISPGIAQTGAEFGTLARLCAAAGGRSITLMSDVVPPRANKCLQGLSLGAFVLRLFCNILNAAQSCSCAGMHVEAFFCGMSSHFKLHAHTDEGGLIRPILERVRYPPVVGVLAVGAASYLGLSPREDLMDIHVPQVALGLYLEFVGTLITSDPGGKDVTILVKDGEGSRPSDFSGLRPAFYKLMSRFRDNVCSDYGFHPALVGDDSSHDAYFREDQDDRHLSNDVIVPFFWVEPGPLTTKERDYNLPAIQGTRTDLPLSRAEDVIPSEGYVEAFSRVPTGCAVYLRTKTARPRMEGYQYILSARYRESNGLSCMDVIVDDRLGTTTSSALFTQPGVVDVAARRWTTPHCSFPNPAEGLTACAQAVRFSYRGLYAEPTAEDWRSGLVASFVSPLRVVSRPGALGPKRVSRHVSESNRRWLLSRGRYAPKFVLDLAALPNSFSISPPVLLFGLKPENDELDGETETRRNTTATDTPTTSAGDDPAPPAEQDPHAKISTVDEVTQPRTVVADESPKGPETDLEADPGTGRRIRVPDAGVDTEESVGGEGR